MDKTVFNLPLEYNSPERSLVIATINQALLDARAIARCNAKYFCSEGNRSNSRSGDKWDREYAFDSAFVFKTMAEESAKLMEWLDSEWFDWWLECVEFDPNRVKAIIKEVAAGHREHDVRRWKTALNASQMSTKHRGSKKRH